ncbi:MAG TPA: DUF3800 domain-containing protein [Chitinophagaceae bacterium]|nr:DUF3800 domain-containing protein [Chitinophagaceae bacterium]
MSNVFFCCRLLVNEEDYETIRQSINILKHSIWENKEVIFHSRDIRKCEKEFQKLFDLDLKKKFYEELNKIIANSPYTIIASAIQKNRFIEQFGKLQDDVYEVALSFVIEQAVMALKKPGTATDLSIVIEKRGRKEDKQLDDHFQRLLGKGTGKLTAEEIAIHHPTFTFKDKKENINGLQLADLVAYPIARYVIEPNRANPAFEVLEPKIYHTDGGLDGLRIYP